MDFAADDGDSVVGDQQITNMQMDAHPQPLAAGRPENPYPGIDGITT